MKPAEKYFPVVMFIMLYKRILPAESGLKFERVTIIQMTANLMTTSVQLVKTSINVINSRPAQDHTSRKDVLIQMKATEQYFPAVLFIMLYVVVLTFESVSQILKCVHSNERY